jgi:cytochrome P450 family 142 subfamily A polypeptide 1
VDAQADPDAQLLKYTVRLRPGTRPAQHPTRDDIALLGLGFNADPLERLAWMRSHAPVYWDDRTGIWGVTRHADIMRIEADAATFCSGLGSRPESSVPSMINKDDPEHAARRRLVSAGFTPRRVRQHEAFLTDVVTRLIDDVVERGSCDVVADIATEIPLRMIAKLMDLPEADFDRLVHWSDLFATGGPEVRDQVLQAVRDWTAYIVDKVEQRRGGDGTDLVSLLVNAEPGGEPLGTDDLVHEAMLILVGGDETTRHVMSGGLDALLRHPDQLDRLRADRSLLPGAIEEMLRWVTPVRNMNRTATRDVQVGDQLVREGDRMLLLYLSGNRDETVFDGPERFDITRSPNPHVAFGGYGRHFCLGAQLARLELTVLFDAVLDRLHDLRLAEPEAPAAMRRGNFVLGLERLPVTFRPGPRRGVPVPA